jgi:hypothetical protein
MPRDKILAIGQCFPFAAEKAMEWVVAHPEERNSTDTFRVIHGWITDRFKRDAYPVVHAWVEIGDQVYDEQTSHLRPDGLSRELYYDMYQPEPVAIYSAMDVVTNFATTNTEGPWHEELVAALNKRDAWLFENPPVDFEEVLAIADKTPREFRDLYHKHDRHRRKQWDKDESRRAYLQHKKMRNIPPDEYVYHNTPVLELLSIADDGLLPGAFFTTEGGLRRWAGWVFYELEYRYDLCNTYKTSVQVQECSVAVLRRRAGHEHSYDLDVGGNRDTIWERRREHPEWHDLQTAVAIIYKDAIAPEVLEVAYWVRARRTWLSPFVPLADWRSLWDYLLYYNAQEQRSR